MAQLWDNWQFFEKSNIHLPCKPIILPQKTETIYPEKASCNNVQSTFIYKSQKLKTAQMPFDGGMSYGVFIQWNVPQQ